MDVQFVCVFLLFAFLYLLLWEKRKRLRHTNRKTYSSMTSADCEVFLCHRGPDVKLNSVNVLHNLLCSNGIKSFVDYEMIEGSEVDPAIMEAIKMSKVHIVFLTPNFASSKWCLNELLEIMNRRRAAGTSSVPLVLPVFYDVEPSDVRHQPKNSAYNLAKKTKRSTPQERTLWSKALKEISLVKGFEYDTKVTRQWEKLQEIVTTVENFLNETFPRVYEPEWRSYFAGQIDDVVKALESSGSKSKDVFCLGVYGANKSIFADLLVDDLRLHFEARCILYNVVDTASHSDGVSVLIRKLYSDLVQKIHEQPLRKNARLDDLLQNKRCLVVIDDIGSDIAQIKALLEILQKKLKKNSLVVFTSRFQHVLRETVKVDKFISLSGGEESKGTLILSYNKRDDVHPAFISHFQETFYMLGFDVCLLSEEEFVSHIRTPAKTQMIICIISKSSNVGYLERALVNASTDGERKVLYVYYRRQSTIGSTSSTSVCLNVNFEESTGQPHKMEYKHLVEEVMEMFKEGNEKSMDVTDFPVGLLQRHKKIDSRIVSHMTRRHRSVQCFGLWGMGGVGKTTTAKSIYNRMHKEFESSAFILNTRANAASNDSGLSNLQQKLLENVMPKDSKGVKINDVDHGKRLLSAKLKGVSAFIVLDDLDTMSQIDALCYPLSSLEPNSIVIITSRDRKILTYASIPEENIFRIEGLSEENSEWLFCWHAFMNPVPPAHLKEVAKKVIKACQGLPLSLTVLGCHLYGANDINKWKESLHLIKQDEEKIFNILGVSLNSLKLSEKEAFLDICCFFIGMNEDLVCAFSEGCYEMGITILTALKSKCLITITKDADELLFGIREAGTIQVHDQLRDMGRHIIQKEEKNRAWDEKTSNDILKDARTLSGLRGLSARTDMQIRGEIATYNALSQLRFLALEEAQEKREMNERMPIYDLFANVRCDELRWLKWKVREELPRGLCSTELRVLHLSHSDIREVPGPLPNLQMLEIQECFNLEGFSMAIGTSMPLLRRVCLSSCPRLKGLDSSIGRLTDLSWLTIEHCDSILHLPEEMKNLPYLRDLILRSPGYMKTLSLPRNLRALELWRCESLESMDVSLPNLEKLDVSECPKLEKLPVLGSSLVQLKIGNCDRLVLDECLELKDLPSLRQLTLHFLRQINTLSLPPSLLTLTLEECRSLESVEASLPNLEVLRLLECPKLKKLPALGGSLQRLKIRKCVGLVLDDECLELKDARVALPEESQV
ncbi:hypothetical protein KP509_35G036900 [Ceratopteris richardii]|uniref:TIR domain-containing protein n=1 Tax=Ceratopteris richardii TaxID=49495 RepID=A0A8T2QEK5_CERRI|nr:hypothetical protein KP509_35G036900 [Ceratopteris richardii]